MVLGVSDLVLETLAWTAAVVTLGGAVRAITGWSFTRYLARNLVTEPAKRGTLAVVDEHLTPRLDKLDASVAEVRAELDYNGGKTTKDMVGLIASELADVKMMAVEAKAAAVLVAEKLEQGEQQADQVVDAPPGAAADAGAHSAEFMEDK